MKDDFSQDEKNFSKMNQTENSSFVNDDSLDWAKQAYLQLKQKQKEQKQRKEQGKEIHKHCMFIDLYNYCIFIIKTLYENKDI